MNDASGPSRNAAAAAMSWGVPTLCAADAAIIERMHDDGVVGPALPSGQREVVASKAGRRRDSAEA